MPEAVPEVVPQRPAPAVTAAAPSKPAEVAQVAVPAIVAMPEPQRLPPPAATEMPATTVAAAVPESSAQPAAVSPSAAKPLTAAPAAPAAVVLLQVAPTLSRPKPVAVVTVPAQARPSAEATPTPPAVALALAPSLEPSVPSHPPAPSSPGPSPFEVLGGIEFPKDSDELAESDFGRLRGIATVAQLKIEAAPGTRLLVAGRSPKGDKAWLAPRRSALIRAFLMSSGLEPSDVIFKAPPKQPLPSIKDNESQLILLPPPK
jgi:hypothetical protein